MQTMTVLRARRIVAASPDYHVVRYAPGTILNMPRGGWGLRDSGGFDLLIGDHGCVAPTEADALLEALHRIEVG